MTDASNTAVAAPQIAQQGRDGGNAGTQNASSMVGGIIRMLVVFWLVKSFFGGSKGPPANAPRSDFFWPKFSRSEPIDFYLYTADSSSVNSETTKPIWSETGVPLATNTELTKTYVYHPSQVRCCIPLQFLTQKLRLKAACLTT